MTKKDAEHEDDLQVLELVAKAGRQYDAYVDLISKTVSQLSTEEEPREAPRSMSQPLGIAYQG